MKYTNNKCFLLRRHTFINRCMYAIYLLCKTVSNHKIFENSVAIYHLLTNGICFIVKENTTVIEYDYIKTDDEYHHVYHNNIHTSYKISDITIVKLNYLDISFLDGAIKHSNILNAINNYWESIVNNGGRPSGIFSISQFSSDEQRIRTKESINTVLNNIGNRGLAAVVEGEYQWKNLGISPKDLQILEIYNVQFEMICAHFHIAPIIIRFEEQTHVGNYKEAREQCVKDFITPLTNDILKQID